MRSSFYSADRASKTARFEPFRRHNAGVTGVRRSASLIKTLHLPWLPLYLLAVRAYEPAIGKPAVLAALAMAALTITAQLLTKRLTLAWASKTCRRARGPAAARFWI
ncbi:MAG: hypothetical protein AAAB35_12745 [Phyllobacterium sp.]|uniref:hypothetical protein n=1 Tax=Phyllobacterium sp. TaxID=1871046 RepID=UPI0030F01EBD